MYNIQITKAETKFVVSYLSNKTHIFNNVKNGTPEKPKKRIFIQAIPIIFDI